MYNENDLTIKCKQICSAFNIDVDVPVKINKRLTATLGRVKYTRINNAILPAAIEFSYIFLETATDESIEQVILHECAHYLVAKITHVRHGHDIVFKEMCQKLGCTNNTAHYEALQRKDNSNSAYKYIITCDCCGSKIFRSRSCKLTNYPNLYICKCGGSLHVTKNF